MELSGIILCLLFLDSSTSIPLVSNIDRNRQNRHGTLTSEFKSFKVKSRTIDDNILPLEAPGDNLNDKTIFVDGNNDNVLWIDSHEKSQPQGQVLSTRKHFIPKPKVKRLPQAIIIGVKKGGTRALLEFLKVHPKVKAAGPEPHFFDNFYSRGFEWYRNQMPNTAEDELTVEKTPRYFVSKEVPGRIYKMNKDIKLIVVVRDPVTRAISDYTQSILKWPKMPPFEEKAFIDNSSCVVNTTWSKLRIGVYAKHLKKWLKYFPLNQIHFVNGEKLISNPVDEMYKVQDFLGLQRLVTDSHFTFKGSWDFPCLKKDIKSDHIHCLRRNKGRQHPNLKPEVLKRLREFYKPFNLKFYQMTGIDFGW
ncbi:hypothetical protein LOTGIDRAFT_229255 [Lottia gigantea]|uniref:Sulfotransferase domain-containing protein n=1 Tax=Lottia gigantea TaxID=225164 RepID=V3ZWR7_LOTGI|nr:hypothetical protein LOTGIDRAFT_229255 [Lottia gigantea]ESO87065.1 hypothetical protein LOTGIDRAFT_229255 [Lottia gigantea]